MKVILSLAFLGLIAAVYAKEYKCPAAGEGNDVVFIPNVEDCSTYFQCKNGYEILITCPNDTNFDVHELKCMPKNQAHCAADVVDPPAPSETCVQCPVQTSIDDDVLLPNVKNCSTFYHCSYGTPILQACPANLHFNAEKKYCDYPSQAMCVESETC